MRVKSFAPLWVISAVALSFLAVSSVLKVLHMTLAKNVSVSAAIGIYLLKEPGKLEKGTLVTFKLPNELTQFANEVPWLNPTEDLLKPIAAVAGDKVCRIGDAVLINGVTIALAKKSDTNGHILPSWQGCQVIQTGYFFPLSLHHENSFDGRYFGAVKASLVTNVAKPLIVF